MSTDIVSRLRKELPEIQTPPMAGDRLKDIIEEAFDVPSPVFDRVVDANGVLDAIHAHYADLIQSQQALIEEMREALEWAVAEIEGRTRYDKENQFGNCLAKANKALSQKE